jgi:hypothetical protein
MSKLLQIQKHGQIHEHNFTDPKSIYGTNLFVKASCTAGTTLAEHSSPAWDDLHNSKLFGMVQTGTIVFQTSDFLINSDSASCPIDHCELDTRSSTSSCEPWVTFDSNSPWTVTFDTSTSGCTYTGDYGCTTTCCDTLVEATFSYKN